MKPQQNNPFSLGNDMLRVRYFWFRKIDSLDESLTTDLHRHTFFELHYVLSGSLQILAEGNTLEVAAGDWVLIPKNTLHQILQPQTQTKKIVFGFNVDGPLRKAFEQSVLPVQKHSQTRQLFAIQNLYFDYGNSPVDMAKKASLLPCLFLELLTALEIDTTPPTVDSSTLFDRVTKYVDDYMDMEAITVESLAKQFWVSPRHLERIFHQFAHLSAGQYLAQKKVDQIKLLLESPQYSLDDIAFICRFSGASSMIRFFKNREGITPTKYRQKFAKK